MLHHLNWRLGVAVLAVLLLSAPAAVGVFRALEPTRGAIAAGLAAAGIELTYLSLALLTLRPDLRRHAGRVAVAAVATSITLNVLADYATRVPGGLASWPAAVARFDPLALGLAVLESAPLAGLAFALASLLHRLAEAPDAVEEVEGAADGVPARNAPKTYTCRKCGAGPFDFGELGRHARGCKAEQPAPTPSAPAAGD